MIGRSPSTRNRGEVTQSMFISFSFTCERVGIIFADKEEFAAAGTNALKRVRMSGRKVPQVSFSNVANVVTTFSV